jgi:hypothetical protein
MSFKKSPTIKTNTFTIIYSIFVLSFTVEIISQYNKQPTDADILFFSLNTIAYFALILYQWKITRFRRGFLIVSIVFLLNFINLIIKLMNYGIPGRLEK